MGTTSNSTKHKTMRTDSKNERKVPPIIIKRTNKNEDNVDLDRHTTHNSDDEFRSPRRTSKIYDSPTEKLFKTSNRYSILDNTNTNDQEMFSFNDNTLPITQTDNQKNHPIQSQSTEATPKIPTLFILNITQYSQFRNEITKIISNEFTSTSKYDKIKINLETVDDFRTLTKYLDEKKYDYYTYKLKTEKDISAIIRNLPMSITEFEVMEELKILEYPVKSVTRLTKKYKIPTLLMAVQLMNHHKSQEIFKLSKLLNCIVITEPRRKSKAGLTLEPTICDFWSEDRDTINLSGGVAILIKRIIKHHQLITPELTNLEATSIMVSTDKYEIKIISAYNPPNKKIQRDDINELFKDNPTILLGDLNLKNEIGGCLKSNPNGNKLFQFTSELRIIISPPSKPTFHRTGRQPDILDIALVSNLKAQLYHQVANELDSYHVPVITTLYEQMELIPQTPKLGERHDLQIKKVLDTTLPQKPLRSWPVL
ncbi:hypothetical protein QTP88_026151 [Uroleucon formosanum]